MSEFRPRRGFSNPHLQTVIGRLVRSRRLVETDRESVETPDGDEIILDHLEGDDSRRFVLFHGLEGSSNSVYIQGLLALIRDAGCSATAVNFRSCARERRDHRRMIINRRPRMYHSGETSDIDFVIRLLRERLPDAKLLGFGGSLGGNALLKWLGETSDERILHAAATISVPYDLGAGAAYLDNLAGRLYVGSFLRTLRDKAIAKRSQFPEISEVIDWEMMERARTFREFDEAATAPLHGMAGADHYYETCSSIFFVGRITTPTLCLSARDDPFLPPSVLDRLREEASDSVEVEITEKGGHLGFAGAINGQWHWWAEHRVVDWLLGQVRETTP